MEFHSSGDVDPQQNLHLSPHAHHFNGPQSGGPVTFVTPFRHHPVSPVDPHAEAGASRGLHTSPTLLTHPTTANIGPQPVQSVQQTYYTDSSRPIHTPSTPSQQPSPRFAHTAAPSQGGTSQTSFIPADRSLPSRNVSDETIDDAYAMFILYCNPSFSTDTDPSELKKAFRTPPKSESKSFSTFRLFELIGKLEAKEIKTWTELALELGVEKPNAEKKQSTQKVQQYTVRLKRWMRALHIDAFFEYLLDKPHPYCRQIPHPNDPFPEVRDGVTTEEDLAIRALDPKYRPKRGRRKADDQEDEAEPMSAIEPKRPHLDTSVAFGGPHAFANPQSALPTSAMGMSAHPDDLDRFVHDPWASATTPGAGRSAGVNQQFRWRVTSENPQTPHPMSAVTPISAQPPDAVFDEPQSAASPNPKPRSRRRHGPAVSSAWSSNNTTPNGRLRGRPPSNRSVRDGPFVTFPANPKAKEGPTIDLSRNQITATSADTASSQLTPQHVAQQPTPISSTSQHAPIQPLQSRPERMQLQIPQHTGNPVHLVTPTVLINGSMSPPQPPPNVLPTASTATGTLDTATSFRSSNATLYSQSSAATDFGEHDGSGFLRTHRRTTSSGTHAHDLSPLVHVHPKSAPALSNEDIKRGLAADLLRADISGLARGRKRLRGSEAKDLAAALLARLGGKDQIVSNSDVVVSWLGLDMGRTSLSAGPSTGTPRIGMGLGQKRITVQRYRVNGDGYDSPIDDDDADVSAPGLARDGEDRPEVREAFDVEWTSRFGALNGSFHVRGLSLGDVTAEGSASGEGLSARSSHRSHPSDPRLEGQGNANAASSSTRDIEQWKSRLLDMEKRLEESQEEVQRLREKVLEAVL